MTKKRSVRHPRSLRPARRSGRPRRLSRRPKVELLEPRLVLAGPSLAPLGNVVLYAGAPLHLALDGSDADDDPLTYQVSVSNVDFSSSDPNLDNPQLTTFIPEGNRSMRISVAEYLDPDTQEVLFAGGDLVFELFEGRAPNTTSRIIELAKDIGYYTGKRFDRVFPGFVIQGGSLNGDLTGGSGKQFDDEFHPELRHTSAGLLSMAKGDDDTNDAQFFITAPPTASLRALDFNHTVFGLLTEGEGVRQAIEQEVPRVDWQVGRQIENSKPVYPLDFELVEIFEDHENAVLMLSAPVGTFGEADVKVTVSDGNEPPVEQTFRVQVLPDPYNGNPYLVVPIDPVETTVDTPVTFTLQAVDVEGDPVYFAGWVDPANPDLAIEVGSQDGVATVTPGNGLAGVHGVSVAVLKAVDWDGQSWDEQAVPVYITPNAPTKIELLTSSPDDDRLTNLDNTQGNTLRFRVSGLVKGAEVYLYAGDKLIGQATAEYSDRVIITNGTVPLSHGQHTITAVQALLNQPVNIGNSHDPVNLVSEPSAPLEITVDLIPPEIISDPVTDAAEGRLYVYDLQTDEPVPEDVTYRLETSPGGMSIDPDTDQIIWTPGLGQAEDSPVDVVVVASDKAGNEFRQQFVVTVKPAPRLKPIGSKFVDEEQELTFTAQATGGEGDLVFSLDEGAPKDAAITPTGEFTWATTEADGPHTYWITVRVTDQIGASSHETIMVNVGEVNQPPVLAPIVDQVISEGELLEFYAVATDADVPANPLRFDLPGAPQGASIHPVSGRFRWTPNEQQGGQEFEIKVRVWDEFLLPGEQTFKVTVNEVDDPPQFGPVDTPTVVPGQQLRVTVTARDPDDPANSIRYSLDAGPDGAQIDPDSGEITWDVPVDVLENQDVREVVELTVRATEVVPQGVEGLSTTQTLEVIVVDPRGAVALAISEVGAEQEEALVAPLAESLMLLEAEAPAPAALPPVQPVDSGGVRGIWIGSVDYGGTPEQEEEGEIEEGEEESQPSDTQIKPISRSTRSGDESAESDDRTDEATKTAQSDRSGDPSGREAGDEPVESLLASEGAPATAAAETELSSSDPTSPAAESEEEPPAPAASDQVAAS